VHVRSLRHLHLRNLVTERLAFEDGVTALVGPNAAGKSNVLEAIVLGTTGTAAGGRVTESLRFGVDQGFVRVELEAPGGEHVVEVGLAPGRKVIRLDGQVVRAIDLATLGGVVLVEPEDLGVILGPPARRRAFLDHVLGRLSLRYALMLREYQRVVEQRNALLRSGAAAALFGPWDERFVALGGDVAALRRRAVSSLAQHAADAYDRIAGEPQGFAVALDAATDHDDLAAALAATRSAERARGATLVGPHRDELRITLDGRLVQTFGSRGEARTAALALRVAERALLEARHGRPPLLLIDDVHAELDERRRAFLMDLAALAPQAIVTGTEAPPSAARVWRIEDGRVETSQPAPASAHDGVR
jgi:DNA replication and repair protein RecF